MTVQSVPEVELLGGCPLSGGSAGELLLNLNWTYGLLAALAALGAWYEARRQFRRKEQQKGWELLQEAKCKYSQALRSLPEFSPVESIGRDFTDRTARRRSSLSEEQLYEWRDQLDRREVLLKEGDALIRRSAELGLSHSDYWNEVASISFHRGLDDPAVRACWQIYRSRSHRGFLLLHLSPQDFQIARVVLGGIPPLADWAEEFAKIARRPELLKHAPSALRHSPGHPGWDTLLPAGPQQAVMATAGHTP